MKIIIGLVGEKGSGKETFGNFLIEVAKGKKVTRVRFSDLLNETLELWDIPKTRENLQNLAVIMDQCFGVGTLTHAISQRLNKIDGDIILLDGVRWESDEKMIRSFSKNLLVYISADAPLRFERLQKRKEKHHEAETFEQFIKEETAKNELLIPKIGKRADIKIENNESFEDLKEKVNQFYSKFIQ